MCVKSKRTLQCSLVHFKLVTVFFLHTWAHLLMTQSREVHW